MKKHKKNLLEHINALKQIAPYHEVAIASDAPSTFVAPILFELKDLSQLKKEVFLALSCMLYDLLPMS